MKSMCRRNWRLKKSAQPRAWSRQIPIPRFSDAGTAGDDQIAAASLLPSVDGSVHRVGLPVNEPRMVIAVVKRRF